MKYICTLDIECRIEKVVAVWDDEQYFSHWQDGFQSIELLAGKKGQPGARSRILFRQGGGTMELIETILINRLPEEKTGLYEHIHMTNTQTTRFVKLGEARTRYISEVEYTKFRGLIPKLMATFLPGKFKKQSMKWMKQFKTFVERRESI